MPIVLPHEAAIVRTARHGELHLDILSVRAFEAIATIDANLPPREYCVQVLHVVMQGASERNEEAVRHLPDRILQRLARTFAASEHGLNRPLPPKRPIFASFKRTVLTYLDEEQQRMGEMLEDMRLSLDATMLPITRGLATKKPEIEHSYWVRCEQYIRVHIKPTLGKVLLVRLNAQQLTRLYAMKTAEGQAANTVRHLHTTIHTALEDAFRHDLVPRNVADLAKPPKAPHLEMKTLTPDQANHLLAVAKGDRLAALYVLMLTSACRIGELLGLRWNAIDFERGELKILSALKDVRGRRSLGTPKTPNSRRTIPLTPRAVTSLKRHHAQQAEEKLAHGSDWNPEQLVFVTSNGTPYSQTNWRRQQYIPMLTKAGLPYIRPHGLRHTAATLLLLEGVQPLVVSEMLGHSSVAFTLSTYGHVQSEMRKPARDAMERLFGGISE